MRWRNCNDVLGGAGMWFETYRQCGCVIEAHRKKDLMGYCAKHGTDRANVYRIGEIPPSPTPETPPDGSDEARERSVPTRTNRTG